MHDDRAKILLCNLNHPRMEHVVRIAFQQPSAQVRRNAANPRSASSQNLQIAITHAAHRIGSVII
jgi:hypothetical protein